MLVRCPNCDDLSQAALVDVESGSATCAKCGSSLSSETLVEEPGTGSEGDTTAVVPSVIAGEVPDLTGREMGGCRIERTLGRGAVGIVYKAHHIALDIPVALKILRAGFAETDEIYIKRFVREARAAAKLQHQNIVGVLNVGEDNGTHFIVMQYVDGETLQARLEREGKLPLDAAIGIMQQICEALELAGQHSTVHRDIKPSNIMIDRNGVAKLADLGLAKADEPSQATTHAGASLGTPYFMSPEQTEDAARADHRSDLYSLGCTFYYAVCGKLPYDGFSVFQVLSKHVSAPIPDPRDAEPRIPANVANTIIKLMAKRPEGRYQTAGEVGRQLRHIQEQLGSSGGHGDKEAVPDLDGARVLVVDDLGQIRLFFKRTLERANAVVSEASDGLEALQALNRASEEGAPFELLITDVHMPKMDGAELLQRVRSDPNLRDTPVIVITMEDDETVVLEFAKLGISGYLVKPPRRKEVLRAAKRALETRGSARALRQVGSAEGGLSVEQVRLLYEMVTEVVGQEIEDGASPHGSIFEAPMYVAFIEFLQRHCPDAVKKD